ncbi:MAG TPA: hypothetical protein VL360_04590 [Gammaproteobacteria bacterium]|nr:hypothetical protein [Gammaproteobacteria bacterium]
MDDKLAIKSAATIDDLPGIARQIYTSTSQFAELFIGRFKFECDTTSGQVKNVPTQERGVHYLIGRDSMDIYTHHIGRGLSCASKRRMLDKIESLGDAHLNSVIGKHKAGLETMLEPAVNKAMASVFLEVKMPVFNGFGLFQPRPQNNIQRAVFKALHAIGTDNIQTFSDVDNVYTQINDHLKLSASSKTAARIK